MKKTLDPCEDFYQYVCGGWFDTNTIPATQSSWSIDSVIIRERDQKLRGILESPIENYHRDSAEKKIKLMYQTCMDVDTIDNEGVQPLMPAINSYGGWAVKGHAFYILFILTRPHCASSRRETCLFSVGTSEGTTITGPFTLSACEIESDFFLWCLPSTLLVTSQKMSRLPIWKLLRCDVAFSFAIVPCEQAWFYLARLWLDKCERCLTTSQYY